MAVVRIDNGSLPSAIGVEGNALLRVIAQWQSIADGRFPDDCSALLQMVDETDRLRLWEKKIGGHTFNDRNEFLQRQVLIDFNLTEQSLSDIVARLRRGERPNMRAMRIAKAVKPLPEPGGDHGNQHSGGKRQADNVSLPEHGNSAAYLAARLKRDHPEIAEQLVAGEFRSVRAAAKAAGIVKEKTALDHLKSWWAKASEEERAAFRTEIATM